MSTVKLYCRSSYLWEPEATGYSYVSRAGAPSKGAGLVQEDNHPQLPVQEYL